jgi:outer membrane protein TolC
MKKSLLISFFAAISICLSAQPLLTVDEALRIGLANNYDIQLYENDALSAKANNTAGNAGMLPTVGINGGDQFSYNAINQHLTNGTIISSSGAPNNNLNGALALNWTLFDGTKMFVTKAKLNQLQELGEINVRIQLMQSTADIISAYYDIVRQEQQLKNYNELMNYNAERVKIFETRFNNGLSPKTDLLPAKIDLNTNKENALYQQTIINNSKRKLNLLLGRDASTPFSVSQTIENNFMPDTNSLRQLMNTQNPSIAGKQKELEVAHSIIKEFKTLKYPKLVLNAGYNFSRTDSRAGFTLLSQAYGPQVGATLNIPLFQGGNINRQIKVASYAMKSSSLQLDRLQLQLNNMLQSSIDEYLRQLQLLSLEEENAQMARENMQLSLARLKQGQTNALELQQSQVALETSLTRLNNIRYALKLAETQLKQITGAL